MAMRIYPSCFARCAVLLFTVGCMNVSAQLRLLPGDATIAPAAGDQATPAIARGSNTMLVVWADNRANPYPSGIYAWSEYETSRDIYGVRLDLAGNVLDSVPLAIVARRSNQNYPRLCWNGSNWLVVYQSVDVGGTGYYQASIEAVRVAPSGQVLDANPIKLNGLTTSGGWAVASDGDNWVVVNQGTSTGNDIVAIRISAAGMVLDPPTRVLVSATENPRFGGLLAYAGGVFAFNYGDNNNVPKLGRFNSNLTPLAPATLPSDIQLSALASNDTNLYSVWNRQEPSGLVHVVGSRVSTAGAILDGTGVNLSGTKEPSAYATTAVAWDGVNWRVTWGQLTTSWSARVNSAGTVLDPGSVAVVGVQTGRTAGNGTGALQVIWTESTNMNNDVFTANISPSSVAGPTRTLSVGAPQQTLPDIATSGNGYMAVCLSRTAANSRVLAHPLDAAGNPLTAQPVQLDLGPSVNGPGNPSVAWNGSLYLVSWGATNGIVAQRLQPNGTKIDAAPFMVMSGCFGPTDVAALGNDFLITGRKVGISIQYIGPVAARVSGAGAVLDPSPLFLGISYLGRAPAVVALGGRWFAAWHRNATHDNSYCLSMGAFINASGTVTPEFQIHGPFSTAGGNGIFEVGLASSGNTALFVQSQELTSGVENDLLCHVIDAAGAVGPQINLTPWSGNQYRPRVAWDGANFIVTYQDQKNRLAPNTLDELDARSDLFAMRISPVGAILDPQGFLLSASPIGETDPTVISQNGVSLFAWAQMLNDAAFANYRIVTTRLDASANQWPVAVANVSTNEGNIPLAVNFSSAGSTDPDGIVISYFWEFGDGTSSTAPNPIHTFTTADNYVVRLTVTDNHGATTTQTVLLKASLPNQIPVAVARAVPQSGPAPLNAVLYADGSYDPDGPIGNIEWISDDGSTYWGSPAYFTFTVNGTHTVTLRVYDNRGDIGTTNILINVGGPNLKPVAAASASPTNGPAPLWVYFSAAGSHDTDGNIVSYAWTFGDGGTADYASPTWYYANPGTYTAKLIVTDNAGGKDTNSVTIWVGASNRPPVAVVSANPTKGTVPLTVNFNSAGSGDPDGGIASYSWSFGDGGTSMLANPTYTYGNRGIFLARLTVNDNLGATASKSVTITVRRPPKLTGARVPIPGAFSFNLEGETNVTYIIESSTDGLTWTNVITFPSPDMPAQVTVPASADRPVLFWRAVMQ